MERKGDFNFKHVTRDEIFKATWIFVTKTWICATNDPMNQLKWWFIKLGGEKDRMQPTNVDTHIDLCRHAF
jgi:hypothetical protein